MADAFTKKTAFIGAGKMASAIARGLVSAGMPRTLIRAYDVSPEAAKAFDAAVVSHCCASSAAEALADAEVVVLAVKPQHVADCLPGLAAALAGKLLVSIVAGLSLARLREMAGHGRIVRAMPNTPALVGRGVTALSIPPEISAEDAAAAKALMSSVGRVRLLPESLMDAVTGLSGSGPAYVYEFIQAMADAGVYLGMPRDAALELAAATVAGSAELALSSGRHPALLRDDVTSPGGTTSRGLAALDAGAFRSVVAKAVVDAAARSAELGR